MNLEMNLKAQSNSKSGHKNIHYDESVHSYVVRIYRNGKLFVTYANNLEEAISVRDKAYEFYEKNGSLPTKSELGLTRRSHRAFKERVKKVMPKCVCKICRKTMSYRLQSKVEAFERRGNVCGNCRSKDRAKLSLEIKPDRPNRLNEKYIFLDIKGTRTYYKVSLSKRRRVINKSFLSLKDAIVFRDQMLDFYKEHNRLPDDSELARIFGMEFYDRPISNALKQSKHSSTGLKNISYHPVQDVYYVNIARDRIKTTVSFKTLEEAKLARQILLNTYEESGVMLSPGEVRAKMREMRKETSDAISV